MAVKRERFAAVMLLFKVRKGCTAALAKHVAWDSNKGDAIDVDWRLEDRVGADTLAVKLSRGHVGASWPVMIDREVLARLVGAASSYAEDLSSGLDDGTYDEDPGLEQIERAITKAERLLK